MAVKATTTIRQVMHYHPEHDAWFAANQVLFNQVAAFYFEVIQAHEKILELGDEDALPALEKLTHATKRTPTLSCPSPRSARIFRPCSGGLPSTQHWDQLARFLPT